MRSSFLALVGFVALTPAVFAAEPTEYLRTVKPVLTARCYACHGALQQKSKLRLDTVDLMKKGGESGAVIVPGNSKKSLLWTHITGTGNASRMPPESEGEALKPTEIEAIRAWIDQGAPGPADEKPETDPKDHWAFKPLVRPAVPKHPTLKNPIDVFLAVEYAKHGLKPQAPAEKRVLLRRLYLDLTGLPPTREEYDAFLADTSANAYEKVVDQLLASKQYTERWGRHWMDIWRYSEWWGLGAEVRNSQKHIRHWRDWILDSLHADKGYDQMVREMIAADELYPTDADRLRATGYLARQYFKFNRNTWLEETVEHTSKAFLGLTMNCTKCHDHKYDPIPQEDFYRMRAFFEPYQIRTDMVKGETNFEKDGIPRAFDCNLETPTYLFVRGNEQNPKKDRSFPPGIPEILQFDKLVITPIPLPPESQNPGLRADVVEGYRTALERQIAQAEEALTQARKALTEVEKKGDPVPPKVEIKKEEPKKEDPASKLTALVADDFATEKPEWWEAKSGKWKYESSKLVQQQTGAEQAVLRLKTKVPNDFFVRWKYTTLGGDMWKSVGLVFDVANGNEVMVYLSAFSGGSKLQVSYKQGAGYVYPPTGTQMREVKLQQLQDVEVRVRDRLINISINGKHALAYQLPIARQSGSMGLVTFDAKAEFTRFELAALPSSVKLIEAGNAVAPDPKMPEVVTIASAKQSVVVAEKAIAAAKAQLDSLTARIAGDRAKLIQPAPKDLDVTIKAAALAEKKAILATAEETLARAEWEAHRSPAPKKAEADKKLVAAKEAVAKAQKDLSNPGTTYASLRGSLKTLESNVETEASRSKPFPATSTGRRSALAQWMTDPRNPLTARVAVNHIWARHFGKPLVTTVFDFGRKGSPPTHPELLDWLAVEFMHQNWSMKHLHKLMVMSNTYQMSSSAKSPDGTANTAMIDGENRWYWRMNSTRMEAQVIRDSLLHLGGELDLTVGGPSIPANDEGSRRRSLYFFQSHNEHNKFLTTFDDANVLECYRRSESIIPQQSLALANSRLAMNAAEKIARRLDEKDDAAFIRTAFVVILGSVPSKEEQAECTTALKDFQTIAMQQKRAEPAMRARINFVHALLNHNDFVTVR